MLISTKGRYALRVMADLAEHNNEKYIPLKEIAARQEISLKYLESIMSVLSKEGVVQTLHGKGGGYRINGSPDDYTVWSILMLTEGSLAPVTCLECGTTVCDRAPECPTLPLWAELGRRVEEYLKSVTVGDLIRQQDAGNYVI